MIGDFKDSLRLHRKRRTNKAMRTTSNLVASLAP
jgi:hypothetical protein